MLYVIAAADPASSPWFYLANFGAVGVILGAILLAVARDKWGSHSERDRLRVIADKVINEILPNTQRQNDLSVEMVRAVGEMKDLVKELARMVEDQRRDRRDKER